MLVILAQAGIHVPLSCRSGFPPEFILAKAGTGMTEKRFIAVRKDIMGNQSNIVKIVVFVPEAHADAVREAMGKAGAGKIGNYTFCSFSTKGTGRFKPEKGAHPKMGKVGTIESVAEEKIEAVCEREKLQDVMKAIRQVHSYEEVAFDIYPLENR